MAGYSLGIKVMGNILSFHQVLLLHCQLDQHSNKLLLLSDPWTFSPMGNVTGCLMNREANWGLQQVFRRVTLTFAGSELEDSFTESWGLSDLSPTPHVQSCISSSLSRHASVPDKAPSNLCLWVPSWIGSFDYKDLFTIPEKLQFLIISEISFCVPRQHQSFMEVVYSLTIASTKCSFVLAKSHNKAILRLMIQQSKPSYKFQTCFFSPRHTSLVCGICVDR